MAKTVGAYELKTHLARLLDEVENGETITITRHGRTVATLAPVARPSLSREEIIAHNRKVLDRMRQMREQPGWPRLTREEIVESIRAGREERTNRILGSLRGNQP